MSNPNSIILCIQDGSVDAERSLVTELVNSIDPTGSRTICVLTKLDIAEQNNVKIERIQRLLSGKLFPMKALNYFAVISGTGNPDSTIAQISAYEEEYFKRSTLFRDGSIKPSQATSQNLISAVSERFWDMVKSSIEREADALRSRQYALEAEWRHSYPNMRELDREELFEKARADIMDDAINFCNTPSKDWDASLSNSMWKVFIPFVFREIYLKNALTSSKLGFQTQVEIILQQWFDYKLTKQSIELAKGVMLEKLIESFNRSHPQYLGNTYKDLFKPIRDVLYEEVSSNYEWLDNNFKNLHVIQRSILLDGNITDRSEWDQACSFMENIIVDNENEVQSSLNKLLGPSKYAQWFTWNSVTPEQLINQKIASHLSQLIYHRDNNMPQLSSAELTSVIQNLHSSGVNTKPEVINILWDYIYLIDFYKHSVQGIHDCRRYFRSNDFSKHNLGCYDVILFFKIHKLLQQTVTTIRQQISNQEARRLENFLRNTLENYQNDPHKMTHILNGKQVELAVELKRVSQARTQLEKFIESLLRERNF